MTGGGGDCPARDIAEAFAIRRALCGRLRLNLPGLSSIIRFMRPVRICSLGLPSVIAAFAHRAAACFA